jgi:hypothetical protein
MTLYPDIGGQEVRLGRLHALQCRFHSDQESILGHFKCGLGKSRSRIIVLRKRTLRRAASVSNSGIGLFCAISPPLVGADYFDVLVAVISIGAGSVAADHASKYSSTSARSNEELVDAKISLAPSLLAAPPIA